MRIDRSNSPQSIGVIKFTLPRFNKFVLDNGLEVLFVQKDNLPVVQLNMLVNGGSKFDPANKSGLAHLTSLLVDEVLVNMIHFNWMMKLNRSDPYLVSLQTMITSI